MKKILSVALSTAMAFSMFASVAFGADAKLTPEQQFNALKEAGIVSGFPDGLSHLERTLTRAELAKIIVNSLSLEPVDATSYNDKNYANHWGRPYIEAATQAGILNGKDAVKKLFDPNGAVTVQELAKVLVTALKLEVPADANNTASEWAKGYVAAAVNAGYLADGINYQAQATRSQAVVAAYAIYEAAQVPTVKSYKVLDSKNVEFTLSNGEVVKVTLEKELEANKETEVTFKTADGKEITAKVTYVVTAATKVESVSADNLKQITVKFDGEVDKASAEAISNYKLNREIKSAELSSDARSVVLTLEGEYYSANGGNQLVNQTETKITVDGVKSSDKTRTLKQEVKFTPVDVTTPAVKEVVGLGTKAIKVVFSEPIDRATASASSNYKIDGKSIAGYVEYAFPNSVIITTDTEVGDHKLTVSNVQDFSGLKVVPVETSFSVAEDKEAPAVVKAESSDLTKVTIEFDEPVKSVSKIYNGISSKTGDVTLDKASNKVTVKFTKANALSVGENTIVIEGVTDYSGNSANREVKITPELDTARPEVTGVSVEVNSAGNHVLKVKYSEPVYDGDTNTTGAKQANYTVKDKDGKVVVGKGLDASGHPVKAITFNSDKDEATIELSGKLDKGTYTLEVSGVQDNAYVPNTILPVSKTFEVGDTSALTVTRFWVEEQNTTTTKRDVYFYVMFSKPVATSGVGSATEIAKYIIDWGTGAGFEALPSDASVELVTPEVAKIIVPYTDKAINRTSNYNTVQLKVSLIADQDGNFAYKDSGSISPAIGTDYANITVSEVNATAKDKITVKFAGKLINVDANEFQLQSATVTSDTYGLKLTGYSYDGGNTIANFTLVDGEKIAAKADVKLVAKGTIANTKDAFNNVVAIAAPITVNDKIKPSVVKPSDSKPFVLSGPTTVATGEEYTATVKFDEAINVVPGTGVVKVSVTGTDLVSTAYAVGTNPDELVVTFVTENALANDAVVSIELLSSNGDAKAVTDASTNAVDSFTLSGVVNRLR